MGTVNIAYVFDASQESVDYITALGPDHRSRPKWCRFANGDLALIVFPQAEGYEGCERLVENDCWNNEGHHLWMDPDHV